MTGAQGESGNAGSEPVQPPVWRAGALGIDADGFALGQQPGSDVDGGCRGVDRTAVDRHVAEFAEQACDESSTQSGLGEVLGFGEVHDLPTCRHGGEYLICGGEVVGGKDRRSGARNVLQSAHVGPEVGTHEGIPDQLGGPVQHRSTLSPRDDPCRRQPRLRKSRVSRQPRDVE
jgi:hypothetical protein